jgi:hypothetical protein
MFNDIPIEFLPATMQHSDAFGSTFSSQHHPLHQQQDDRLIRRDYSGAPFLASGWMETTAVQQNMMNQVHHNGIVNDSLQLGTIGPVHRHGSIGYGQWDAGNSVNDLMLRRGSIGGISSYESSILVGNLMDRVNASLVQKNQLSFSNQLPSQNPGHHPAVFNGSLHQYNNATQHQLNLGSVDPLSVSLSSLRDKLQKEEMEVLSRINNFKRRFSGIGFNSTTFFDETTKPVRRDSMLGSIHSIMSQSMSKYDIQPASIRAFNKHPDSSSDEVDDDDSDSDAVSVAYDQVEEVQVSIPANMAPTKNVAETPAPSETAPQISIANELQQPQMNHVFAKFSVAMERSQKSQQDIHDWDRKMGLKRSHSKTMRQSTRSRKKLRAIFKTDIIRIVPNR